MVVVIKCELSEPCELNESKIHDLADYLNDIFEGTCEYFEVEKEQK